MDVDGDRGAKEASGCAGLRVLITVDTIGGVWTYGLELMRALDASGTRFALATMGRRLNEDQRRAAESLPHVEVYESGYKLEWMENPWADVAAAGRWLLELEREWKPDLVHLNGYAHGALPWKAPVVIVAHSCVYSWFASVRKHAPPPEWQRYRRHVGRGLERADAVVAPTRAMLDALNTHYEGRAASGTVIPNGRDPHGFHWAGKEPYIFTAGRIWDDGKNLALLGHIARYLPWPVFAAGDPSHPDGGLVAHGGMGCLGPLSSQGVAEWLSRASIYALPARYEPFGLSVLEAALSGCALVIADLPSLRENWEGAAVFVSPDDPGQWTEALASLTEDEKAREQLGVAARKRARAFSATRMGTAYQKLYLSLTGKENVHENRSVLSLASLGLESRERAFSPRLRRRTAKARSLGENL